MRVIWSATALDEVERIYDYLVERNSRAAIRVVGSLREEGYGLAHFPNRGRLVPGTNMRELATSWSYIIRYEVTGDVVGIIRIRHSSRRPTTP